ncbi:hypothetical protein GH714_025328 [Hevea brasiliensis]|uniref:PGG domain-containing protein n=1 Tax=Hevea brasiliensis TaxID=3981 RepID=A0A6A6MYE5_HEVBR|nr:hypothetical protein GH714_025328 [Hevea brasiliensis]
MTTHRYINADLQEAAKKGKLDPFKAYQGNLGCLLTPNENTILHIYLTSSKKRTTNFIKEVVGICPSLLLQVNNHGDTPLHIAARCGHTDAAKELIEQAKASVHREIDIERGEDPKKREMEEMKAVKEMLRMRNKIEETALHEAARNEKGLDVVKEILNYEVHDHDGFKYSANDCEETPIYLAAENGCYEILDKLNEILKLMTELGAGPLGEISNTEGEMRKEKMIHKFEKVKDSHLVAAALIATVTFAAAFTIPGGYISDENDLKKGTPILSKSWTFKAFIVSDTIAMVLSTCSVFTHLMLVILGFGEAYYWLIRCAFGFLFYAMVAMVITFVAGIYAVLAPSLGFGICIIGFSFLLFLLYSIARVSWGLYSSDDDIYDQLETFSWLTGGILPLLGIFKSLFGIFSSLLADLLSWLFAPLLANEILTWMEYVGTGLLGKIEMRNKEVGTKENMILKFEKVKDSHLVATALIATVAFEAMFTLRGEFVADYVAPGWIRCFAP